MKKFLTVMLFALFGSWPALAQMPIGQNTNGTQVYGTTNVPLTAATTIAATTFTTTGIALPSVPASTTVHGYCHIVWQQATAAATVSFGAGFSNAPTDAYIFSSINTAASGTATKAYTTLTAAGPTIIGAAATPGAAATNYEANFDFVLVTGTSPAAITLYGLTSNASDALVIQPGSNCGYQN